MTIETATVLEHIARFFGLPRNSISPELDLASDLHATAGDLADLRMDLGVRFQRDLPRLGATHGIRTIQDLLGTVASAVSTR